MIVNKSISPLTIVQLIVVKCLRFSQINSWGFTSVNDIDRLVDPVQVTMIEAYYRS